MKFQPSRKRNVGFVFVIIFTGIVLGTAFSQLVGMIVPEGVVRDFFIKSLTIGWQPFTLDLYILSFTLGFSFDVSVISIVGVAVAWYYLRYFR